MIHLSESISSYASETPEPGLEPESLYLAVDAVELAHVGALDALDPEELAWLRTDERGLAWRADVEAEPVADTDLVRAHEDGDLVLFRIVRSTRPVVGAVLAVRQWRGLSGSLKDCPDWRWQERVVLVTDPSIARMAEPD